MKKNKWDGRIIQRADMSSRITHLTRGIDNDDAFEKLWKILIEKKLIGSTNKGFISGERRAVCLQESPLSAIAENLLYEQTLNDRIRYSPFGIRFHKGFIYNRGGRPVIYENRDVMMNMLPKEEYWRIVDMKLSDSESYIDWSHEREWRVPGDLKFGYKNIEVIVYSDLYYRKLVKRCITREKEDILTKIHGIVTLNSIYM